MHTLMATPTKSSNEEIARLAEQMQNFEKIRAGASPEELAKQIAKQNATQAHTVFRAGGDIVGVYYKDGTTTYPSGGDVGGSVVAQKEGLARGLSGKSLDDFIVQSMTDRLSKIYGSGLEVQTTSSRTGPTQGQLNAEMFGASKQNMSSLFNVELDANTLDLLNGR